MQWLQTERQQSIEQSTGVIHRENLNSIKKKQLDKQLSIFTELQSLTEKQKLLKGACKLSTIQKDQRLQNKTENDFNLTESKASFTNLSHTKTCCTGAIGKS